MSASDKIKEVLGRLKSFIVECKRVFQVTKKPGKQEFLVIIKVAGLGILAIGLIGFLLQLIKHLLFSNV
ncbi:MAG: protein translocase SEC61 complex subunit gamma [Candidatus Woesearchaeota archaeon]